MKCPDCKTILEWNVRTGEYVCPDCQRAFVDTKRPCEQAECDNYVKGFCTAKNIKYAA